MRGRLSGLKEVCSVFQVIQAAVISVVVAALVACGGGSADPGPAPVNHTFSASFAQGATPFLGGVEVRGAGIQTLSGYSFTIQPKPGSVSAPVHVTYSNAALKNRGITSGTGAGSIAVLPVFGLYSNFNNVVSLDLQFADGSSQTLSTDIQTPAYTDPTGVYSKLTVLKQRAPGSQLGFDFFAMKSALGSPVIVDTDGEIRWIAAGVSNALSSALTGDGFVIGDPAAPIVRTLSLEGKVTQAPLQFQGITDFHHNVDPGKQGFLVCLDTATNIESIAAEITTDGQVIKTWDMGAILSAYMQANGDDPTLFVRPGVDWFHMNALTYDSNDDSIIVSSREDFLIKLDYQTGEILWILGDPTKYWFTFPSLRAKALTLEAGGLYPIGQHAVSVTSDDLVLIFNDGLASFNAPSGEPNGENRTFSTVSAYSIDAASGTAREVWDFDYGQTILSSVCSSVYEAPGKTYLVDYAVADNTTNSRLVGLDAQRNVVFDFQYPNAPQTCNTSWNAVPIALDNLAVVQ